MSHRSYYLELLSREDFRPKSFPESICPVIINDSSDWDRCRFLWKEVGKGFWSERSEWSHEKWTEHLRREDASFSTVVIGATDAGFFELTKAKRNVKIEGIGLLPTYRGRGFGGGLLSLATQKAFEWDAERVWLHTATDDHPNALPNYLNRGYRICRAEILLSPMQVERSSANGFT